MHQSNANVCINTHYKLLVQTSYIGFHVDKLRPKRNGRHFQIIFLECIILMQIILKLFPWVQLTICHHLFWKWLGTKQTTSYHLYQWRLNELTYILYSATVQWRHNECDGVSNHQPRHCLLNRLFMRRSKKTSKLRHWRLCGELTGGPWIPCTKGQ